IFGGPPGSLDAEGDRYIEIWNLVFMQYNRDASGTVTPLPRPCVDTGMGLERLAAVLQHVHSNYEIDLFVDLIKAAARETGATDLDNASRKVIADHIRACAFLVVDGVIPGSEGRGYVLRRIIRRAIRHGYKLGQKKPFFYRLVDDLDRTMGPAYPELTKDKARVAQVLKTEEERFGETIDHGIRILDETLSDEGRVAALYKGGSAVETLVTGERGVVVLDKTPFYAESGGQVGDRGELSKGGACLTLFAVEDTQKIQPDVVGHIGEVKTGELKVGDTVAALVDDDARGRTMRNHSATHLMHKALREVLGPHVQQKGSLVDPERTRFDFAHNAP